MRRGTWLRGRTAGEKRDVVPAEIVVVDVEPEVCDGLCARLPSSYRVHACTSLGAALDLCAARPIACALVGDTGGPVIGAAPAFRRHNVPVVHLVKRGGGAGAARALAAGAIDVLALDDLHDDLLVA
ncbi:MAG: hypothetical protein D6689_10730, partial [Deltaproteobacteria bacterium]